MDDKRAAPLPAVLLTFNPGIKGIRRTFRLRAMQWGVTYGWSRKMRLRRLDGTLIRSGTVERKP
jgi:hypothetical protein